MWDEGKSGKLAANLPGTHKIFCHDRKYTNAPPDTEIKLQVCGRLDNRSVYESHLHSCSSESKQTEVHCSAHMTSHSRTKESLHPTSRCWCISRPLNMWQAQGIKYCCYCTYLRTQLSPIQHRYGENIKISHWLGVIIILWSLDILI